MINIEIAPVQIKKERQSGLELLRIIAMLLIVMHHCVMFSYQSTPTVFLQKAFYVLQMGGKLGVNIFVLISAYFMVDKKFKWSRILNIILQTFFYSIIFYMIFLILGKQTFSFKMLFYVSFPIYNSEYWFITIYVVLLFCSPILNVFIDKLSQKKHFWIALSGLLLFTLCPYITKFFMRDFINPAYYGEAFWFIELYFIASYIKKYNISFKHRILWICVISVFVFRVLYTAFLDTSEISMQNNIGNTLQAILLLLIFKDYKFRCKFINIVASTTLGVYLIHENRFIRASWWPFIVSYASGLFNNLIVAYFLCTIGTFIICSIIDYIRLILIHKYVNKLVVKIDNISDNSKINVEKRQ